MAISPKANERCAKLTEILLRQKGKRFYLNHKAADRKAFTVDEKLSTRQVDGDGNVSNFKKWPGPTWHQLEVLEATSPTDQEFIDRLGKFIFEGIDTTGTVAGPVSGGVSRDEIEKIASAKAKEMFAEMLAQVREGKVTVEQAQAKIAQEAEPAPTGLQQDETPFVGKEVKKRAKLKSTVRKKQIEVYTQRARLLNILGQDEEAPVRPSDKWVTAKFRKQVDAAWKAHLEQQPAKA